MTDSPTSTTDCDYQGAWEGKSPIRIGDRIRFIGRPDGERALGLGAEPNTRWLRGGDSGQVTEIICGYPPHRCPDHEEFPNCVCGEDGTADGTDPAPVVAYESQDGGTVPRCISPEDEDKTWKRTGTRTLTGARR